MGARSVEGKTPTFYLPIPILPGSSSPDRRLDSCSKAQSLANRKGDQVKGS